MVSQSLQEGNFRLNMWTVIPHPEKKKRINSLIPSTSVSYARPMGQARSQALQILWWVRQPCLCQIALLDPGVGGGNNGSNKNLCENYVTWKLGTKVQSGCSGFTASRPKLLLSFRFTILGRCLQEGWGAESASASVPPGMLPQPQGCIQKLLFPSHWPLPSRRELGMRHIERMDVDIVV